MPFIADLKSIEKDFQGKVVGSGHCAVFVQAVTAVGHTSTWRQGKKVARNEIAPGTAIATFDRSRYQNYYGLPAEEKIIRGSHIGIYVRQTEKYIEMWQQYKGVAVHKQIYNFQYGNYSNFVNDADSYFVVEHPGGEAEIDSCWEFSEIGMSYNRDQW
jgi:hypothetical protein